MALAFSLQNVQFRRLGRRPRHSLLPCDRDLLSGIVYPLLEWHIVFKIGSFSLRRRLCHGRFRCSRGGGSLAIEKPDAICDHFSHFALLAILSLVRTDLQPPFHRHQPALAEMLCDLLGQLAPCDDIDKICSSLPCWLTKGRSTASVKLATGCPLGT